MSVSAFLDIFPRNVSYHMVLKFVIRPGRDSTAVRFTVSYAISTYHHWRCEFEPWSGRGLFDTTLCNIVLQWLGADRWSFPGTSVYPSNNADPHDILEVVLNN